MLCIYRWEEEHTSVSNVTGTLNTSSSAKQTKDGVLDVVWVVELQVGVHKPDDVLVSVLLRHFTGDKSSWAGSYGTNKGKGDD